MLVLARRVYKTTPEPEEVWIGSHDRDVVIPRGSFIRVVVVDVRPENVRLGFAADPAIPIHRSEVAQSIMRNGVDRKAEPVREPRRYPEGYSDHDR